MDNDDLHDTIPDFQLLPAIRESRHTAYRETPFLVYIVSKPNALGLSLPMLLGVGCVSLHRRWPFHPGWCRGGSLAGSRPSGAWEQEPTVVTPAPPVLTL